MAWGYGGVGLGWCGAGLVWPGQEWDDLDWSGLVGEGFDLEKMERRTSTVTSRLPLLRTCALKETVEPTGAVDAYCTSKLVATPALCVFPRATAALCEVGRDRVGRDWVGWDWVGWDWVGKDWVGTDWVGRDWMERDWVGKALSG